MGSDGNRPDYEDVLREIERLSGPAGGLLQVRQLGASVQGRSIPCAILTDPAKPDDDKQRVLIVAGQHGTEESGRAMALALMEFLLSAQAEAPQVLARQVVAVVPCANPDGAANDTSRNAQDVDVAHTYALEGGLQTRDSAFGASAPAGSPEGRNLEQFALEFAPDVVVDIHGRAGGGMKELAWLMPAWGFSSDRYFLTAMSLAMAAAGEEAGYPQCELSPPGALRRQEGNVVMLGEKLAWQLKSLCLGLETIEQYYRQDDWRQTGLARLRRLLRFGMEDAFGLGESGYPNSLVSGSRIQGLKAHGRTAAARRASRVELTRFLRENFAIADRGADGPDGCAKFTIFSETCHGQNPQRFAILLRIKKPCQVRSVSWRGQAIGRGDEHGYRLWEDGCSVLVQVNLLDAFGGPQRELAVEYDCPYFQ